MLLDIRIGILLKNLAYLDLINLALNYLFEINQKIKNLYYL